jgi:hypothetical protein
LLEGREGIALGRNTEEAVNTVPGLGEHQIAKLQGGGSSGKRQPL